MNSKFNLPLICRWQKLFTTVIFKWSPAKPTSRVRTVGWDIRFEFLTSDIANDVDLVMQDIEISPLKGTLVNTSDK